MILVAYYCSEPLNSTALAVLVLTLNDLDFHDLTALSENLLQLLLVVGGGEVID